MHRFFCREIPEVGALIRLDKGESDHFFRTLRGRVGDVAGLFNGRGVEAEAVVGADRELRVQSRTCHVEPERKLHLFCAAPRRNKLDVLLKQAAELGVWSVHWVICDYSVAEPENLDRMTALLLEGCKQSGNPFLPELSAPLPFSDALRMVRENGWNGCFGDVEENRGVFAPEHGDVAYFVGPEGGFSEREHQMLRAELAGINLGPYILRLETAAVAGVAVLRKVCHV